MKGRAVHVLTDRTDAEQSVAVSKQVLTEHSLSVQGLAYVEFAEEAQASQAVLKMDGMEVEGNKIQVAISNPPRRNMADKPGSSRPTMDMMPRQVYGS